MRLHFRVDSEGEPLEFRGPNAQCSMSDRSCHGHVLGLFRARCGCRVWFPVGILPFFHLRPVACCIVPPAAFSFLVDLRVLLPIDCTVCMGPCELCDWAYSQSVLKPDIGLPFAFLPALFTTAAPSDDCFTAPSNQSQRSLSHINEWDRDAVTASCGASGRKIVGRAARFLTSRRHAEHRVRKLSIITNSRASLSRPAASG